MQSNKPVIEVDIAIVGAGMVGATLAHLLSDLPCKVALIDRRDFTVSSPEPEDTVTFDPRVSALTHASKEMFSGLGVWEAMCANRVSPYTHMHVWDAQGTGSIDFSAQQMGTTDLGHIVENSVILNALFESIDQLSNVQLLGAVEISGLEKDSEYVTLSTNQDSDIRTKLLIAADGANSLMRQLAQFQTKRWDYDHSAIVTTIKTERPHQAKALQRFIETGPLAFLPLLPSPGSTDQHYCSIVWSCIPELADSLMQCDELEFNKRLTTAMESQLGAVQSSAKRFCVPLRQMHATHYVSDNVVLVGDAAHTIHPLAGQGVNLGFLDAQALANELTQATIAGRSVADPIVLKRYERSRKGHNLSTMWMMEGFKHLFAEDQLPVRWLRNLGLNTLDDLPMIKNELARHAMGLKI